MSNEELASLIKAGERGYIGQLWEQVYNLIAWKANKVIIELNGRGGVTVEDLCQSGYFALERAVKLFDPDCGTFASIFMYCLQTEFACAAGYRTEKQKKSMLNNALSLDEPINNDENSCPKLANTRDPDSESAYDSVEESIWQKQLHDALEAALDDIPQKYSAVLRRRYYRDETLKEISDELGIAPETVRQTEKKGIRLLRQPKYAHKLHPFYEFDFYCGTGICTFRDTGMSVQERYLIIMEERQKQRQERERTRHSRLASAYRREQKPTL